MDWTATVLRAAGSVDTPDAPLDGADLAPVLADPSLNPLRKLDSRVNHRQQRALRDGRWKYLMINATSTCLMWKLTRARRRTWPNANPNGWSR